ncbi:MAG TPA: tetratricopeptide repeat protein [Polyangia bacterium]
MSNDGRGSGAEQLLALAQARATGILALWRGQIGKQLFLRDGTLVGAESNLREEALGEVLVGLGVLGKSRLPRLLAEVRRRNQKMGAVLVELGWASPETVLQALSEQVRLRAWGCLRWQQTESRFEATDTFVGKILEYPTALPPLVFNGLRAHPSFDHLALALDAPALLEVTPTARWTDHREVFNQMFGDALEEQLTGGTELQSLAAHPEAPSLLEGLEVMLASGLAELRTNGHPFVVPDPGLPEGARVPIWAGPKPSAQTGAQANQTNHDRIDAELAFTEGKAAFVAGDVRAAVPHFERAVELRGDQAAYHAWLGRALYAASGTDSLARVLATLRESVDIDPDTAEGNRWLAEILVASGDREGARAHLEWTLARRPEQADLVTMLAQIHVETGELALAEKLYRRVITAMGERAPEQRATLWRGLALVLREGGDAAESERAAAMAAQLEGDRQDQPHQTADVP